MINIFVKKILGTEMSESNADEVEIPNPDKGKIHFDRVSYKHSPTRQSELDLLMASKKNSHSPFLASLHSS
jgi:hypothetical protein